MFEYGMPICILLWAYSAFLGLDAVATKTDTHTHTLLLVARS